MTAKLAPPYTLGLDLCKFNEVFEDGEIEKIKAIESSRRPSERDKAQCKTNLHIGIFFDGTRNNYVDYESANNDSFTNVCRLYTMFPGRGVRNARMGRTNRAVNIDTELNPEFYSDYLKIYVPGVGTKFSSVGDQNSGPAGAAAGRYGEDRINWALKQVLYSLHRYFNRGADGPDLGRHSGRWITNARAAMAQHIPDKDGNVAKKDPAQVKQIYVSVFGFSRGSVAARAFSNRFIEMCFADAWLSTPQQRRMSLLNIPVQFDFLGIFDSVASVGGAGIATLGTDGDAHKGHDSWGDAQGLRIHSAIKKCVHLVSAHEVRRCFPVDSVAVAGTTPSNCEEYLYPGVHSDVGGGYASGEQGKANGARNLVLSRIALAHMYRAARLAGVPLKAEEVIQKHKATLTIADALTNDFNKYIALFPTKSGHLPALMKEQYHMYLKWRLTWASLRTNTALKQHQPNLSPAKASDVNDLREANINFAQELAAFRPWVQRGATYYGGFLQGLGHQDWLSLKRNWANIESSTPLTPEAKKMFEHYVHDSWAWFKLAGLEAEQATEAEFQRIERRSAQIDEQNRRILSENTVLMIEYLKAFQKDPTTPQPRTQPLESLPTSEKELLEAYQRNGRQVDGMDTLSAREPSRFSRHPRAPIWGQFQGGGGYLRYRVIYMGGNANHVHNAPPVNTAQTGLTREQAVENWQRDHGYGD